MKRIIAIAIILSNLSVMFAQDYCIRDLEPFSIQKNTLNTINKEKKYYLIWFEVGVGGGFSKNNSGVVVDYSLLCQFHEMFLAALQYSFKILETSNTKLHDFSGLVGIRSFKRFGARSFELGLGFVQGNLDGKDFYTIGIPFTAKLFFTPLRFFGIGLNVMGNLNPKESYAGFTINLQIGKLM